MTTEALLSNTALITALSLRHSDDDNMIWFWSDVAEPYKFNL